MYCNTYNLPRVGYTSICLGCDLPGIHVYYVRDYVRNSPTFLVWLSLLRFFIKHTKNETYKYTCVNDMITNIACTIRSILRT